MSDVKLDIQNASGSECNEGAGQSWLIQCCMHSPILLRFACAHCAVGSCIVRDVTGTDTCKRLKVLLLQGRPLGPATIAGARVGRCSALRSPRKPKREAKRAGRLDGSIVKSSQVKSSKMKAGPRAKV